MISPCSLGISPAASAAAVSARFARLPAGGVAGQVLEPPGEPHRAVRTAVRTARLVPQRGCCGPVVLRRPRTGPVEHTNRAQTFTIELFGKLPDTPNIDIAALGADLAD